MHIETREVKDLKEDQKNSRKHSEKNISALTKSLIAFGQQKPIVIDKDNNVIAGNGTLQAARSINWKALKVVVTRLEGNTKSAFAVADNRTAELADWDDDQLAQTLSELENAESIDLTITGFNQEELSDLVEKTMNMDFESGTEQEQGKLDQLTPMMVKCPECGFEFDAREA